LFGWQISATFAVRFPISVGLLALAHKHKWLIISRRLDAGTNKKTGFKQYVFYKIAKQDQLR
jgi:hypothetical protein